MIKKILRINHTIYMEVETKLKIESLSESNHSLCIINS